MQPNFLLGLLIEGCFYRNFISGYLVWVFQAIVGFLHPYKKEGQLKPFPDAVYP
jgi:hypothetical protein